MKKLLSTFMFVFVVFALFLGQNFNQTIFAKTEIPENVTITLETGIFTQASLNSPMLNQQNNMVKLSVGTKLDVDTTFVDVNGLFYKVSIFEIITGATDGDFGYVLIAHTIDSATKSPQKKLDANAKIKNDNSKIYTKDPTTSIFNETEITLNKNTEVRILDGYNKNKEYTYISFLNSDKEIVSYYIKTIDLLVVGVNYSLIVGISILIACITIVLTVLGIKSKNKKKAK